MSDTWTINDIEFACVGCGQKHVFKIKAENSPVLAAEKSRADALAERVKELEAGEPWKLNIEIAKRADALAEKVASRDAALKEIRTVLERIGFDRGLKDAIDNVHDVIDKALAGAPLPVFPCPCFEGVEPRPGLAVEIKKECPDHGHL